MSIHVTMSQEAYTRLKRERTRSTVSSLAIALLATALLLVLLGFLTIITPSDEPEVLISYQPLREDIIDESPTQQVNRSTTDAPPASSQLTSIITSTASSPVAVPSIDTALDIESADFGADNDFGAGFSQEIQSSETTFFGTSLSGERICYIIDYSLSMNADGRVDLMKQELSRSISKLSPSTEFSMIFFAGPVWLPSDKLILRTDVDYPMVAETLQSNGQRVKWTGQSSTKAGELEKLIPSWTQVTPQQIKASLKQIKETPLVVGTEWSKPLRKALQLSPLPDTIIFMTDGDGGTLDTVQEIAEIAYRKSITINTITLMEPKAREAMMALASLTHGSASMVEANGNIVDLLPLTN